MSGGPKPKYSQQPPGVVQNWSALQCSKKHTEQCGYDHAPVTRGRMRAQYPLPHGPPTPHSSTSSNPTTSYDSRAYVLIRGKRVEVPEAYPKGTEGGLVNDQQCIQDLDRLLVKDIRDACARNNNPCAKPNPKKLGPLVGAHWSPEAYRLLSRQEINPLSPRPSPVFCTGLCYHCQPAYHTLSSHVFPVCHNSPPPSCISPALCRH